MLGTNGSWPSQTSLSCFSLEALHTRLITQPFKALDTYAKPQQSLEAALGGEASVSNIKFWSGWIKRLFSGNTHRDLPRSCFETQAARQFGLLYCTPSTFLEIDSAFGHCQEMKLSTRCLYCQPRVERCYRSTLVKPNGSKILIYLRSTRRL